MPTTPSAKKDLIRSGQRRERNRGRKSAMRTWIKKTVAAVDAGNVEDAEKSLAEAYRQIDKNTKWNQIHANTAARRKSKLAGIVANLKSGGAK